MLTLEKLLTELKPESLNEIVGGHRRRWHRRRHHSHSSTKTTRRTSRTSTRHTA